MMMVVVVLVLMLMFVFMLMFMLMLVFVLVLVVPVVLFVLVFMLMLMLVLILLLLLFVQVRVGCKLFVLCGGALHALHPGGRSGDCLKVEEACVEQSGQIYLAPVALYDFCFWLQRANYALYLF